MSFILIDIMFDDPRRNIMIKKIMYDFNETESERKRKRTIRQRKKSRAKNYNGHFLFFYSTEMA
jgi:hypothetical protein